MGMHIVSTTTKICLYAIPEIDTIRDRMMYMLSGTFSLCEGSGTCSSLLAAVYDVVCFRGIRACDSGPSGGGVCDFRRE